MNFTHGDLFYHTKSPSGLYRIGKTDGSMITIGIMYRGNINGIVPYVYHDVQMFITSGIWTIIDVNNPKNATEKLLLENNGYATS